jgi:hypothetical protein
MGTFGGSSRFKDDRPDNRQYPRNIIGAKTRSKKNIFASEYAAFNVFLMDLLLYSVATKAVATEKEDMLKQMEMPEHVDDDATNDVAQAQSFLFNEVYY